MARYTGPSCKLCRAGGVKLFLKGDRCYTGKCAIERRNTKPGANRNPRAKESEYALQLKEKQKLKRTYGMLERQFYKYYEEASRKNGITGELLIQILERRLDNIVFRLGLAKSRSQARQIVRHGFIKVNDRKVDIPSFLVKANDVVAMAKDLGIAKENIKEAKVPEWLEAMPEGGKVAMLPPRDALDYDIKEQLVVDFYSR